MPAPAPLQFNRYYHIFNRGNNREDIFLEQRNYAYFLALYAQHIEPIADTFAYCLMQNHFHLFIRIKDEKELTAMTGLGDPSPLPALLPSRCFSNLFNAYARALNIAYHRTGALFQRPFSRIEVTSETYLARLVVYIHRNPQKHGFVPDFRDWPHSSYRTLLASSPTRLKRDEVLAWFGGPENLAHAHEEDITAQEILDLAPET